MTLLFTKYEQTLSYGGSRDDDLFRESAGCCDGAAAETSQVIGVGAGDFFDEAKVAQTFEVTDDASCGQVRKKWFQVGATSAEGESLESSHI